MSWQLHEVCNFTACAVLTIDYTARHDCRHCPECIGTVGSRPINQVEVELMHTGFVVMYAAAFALYCWLGATQERDR